MRLPFLQLDSDFIAHRAPTVAALLGCSRAQAVGHLACLWSWALSQGPADAAPTGLVVGPSAARVVRAAAEWEGDSQALLDVLQDPAVGLLESVDGGFRIRGMERYARAWEKLDASRSRAEKSRERARTVRAPDANVPAPCEDVRGKTQNKTQTQILLPTEEGAGVVQVVAPAVQPTKPKAPSGNHGALGEFIDFARALAQPKLPADAPDIASGMSGVERAKLGEAVKLHGLTTMKVAFRLWLGWKAAEDKGYPLGFFAHTYANSVAQAKAKPAEPEMKAKPVMRVM